MWAYRSDHRNYLPTPQNSGVALTAPPARTHAVAPSWERYRSNTTGAMDNSSEMESTIWYVYVLVYDEECEEVTNSICAGDIVYTHLFGKGIIFLNSIDVVNDLLDKRAPLYSDKPRLIMVNEL